MGNVGLLLVGVVLLVNGLASLGVVRPRSVAPLNVFVGGAQVVLPTLVLVQAAGDPAIIDATWPSYLFGFTYLWFGLITAFDLEVEGFGWYSAFVSAIAAYHAVVTLGTDPVFAVVWAAWATMWALFFVLLGLGRTHVGSFDLGRFTGWFLVALGVPTCTVTALFLLDGRWTTSPVAGIGALIGLGAATALSVSLTRAGLPRDAPPQEAPPQEAPPQEAPAGVSGRDGTVEHDVVVASPDAEPSDLPITPARTPDTVGAEA